MSEKLRLLSGAPGALAVNLVPRVLTAAPGLKAMIDLPLPAAIPGGRSRA